MPTEAPGVAAKGDSPAHANEPAREECPTSNEFMEEAKEDLEFVKKVGFSSLEDLQQAADEKWRRQELWFEHTEQQRVEQYRREKEQREMQAAAADRAKEISCKLYDLLHDFYFEDPDPVDETDVEELVSLINEVWTLPPDFPKIDASGLVALHKAWYDESTRDFMIEIEWEKAFTLHFFRLYNDESLHNHDPRTIIKLAIDHTEITMELANDAES